MTGIRAVSKNQQKKTWVTISSPGPRIIDGFCGIYFATDSCARAPAWKSPGRPRHVQVSHPGDNHPFAGGQGSYPFSRSRPPWILRKACMECMKLCRNPSASRSIFLAVINFPSADVTLCERGSYAARGSPALAPRPFNSRSTEVRRCARGAGSATPS